MKNFILNLFNVNADSVEHFSSINVDDSVLCTIRFKKEETFCPLCNTRMVCNGFTNKPINHQFLADRKISLLYQARRYRCTNCGHSQYERNPITLKGFLTSIHTMDQIMRDLRDPRLNYTMIAKRNNTSVTHVIHYFDSFVVIPRLPLPVNMGIDEIHSHMAKRRDASYLGVIIDNDSFNLVDILPSRNKTDLNNFFQRYSKEERLKVKYFTMDMWESYRDIAHSWLPNAVVAVDPFHVIEHLNKCFSQVRIRIMKKYEYGSASYYLLKKWNILLMSDNINLDGDKRYNHVFKCELNYRDILNMILELNEELALAYQLKEMYRRFNSNADLTNASQQLDTIISAFQRSNIKEYEEFTNLLIHWKHEITNSFIVSDVTNQKLSNAKTERMNGLIRTNITISNGLTNFKRFRARMLYCFNDCLYYALTNKLVSMKRDFIKKG